MIATEMKTLPQLANYVTCQPAKHTTVVLTSVVSDAIVQALADLTFQLLGVKPGVIVAQPQRSLAPTRRPAGPSRSVYHNLRQGLNCQSNLVLFADSNLAFPVGASRALIANGVISRKIVE